MNGQITVVDGKQYREVSRKANVGELVLINNADCTFGDYKNGDVWTVVERDHSGVFKTQSEVWPWAEDSEYVVLEPVTSGTTVDLRAQIDGLTQTVASLTLRVTELERKASAKLSVGDMTVKVNVDTTDITDLAQKLDDAMRAPFRKQITRDEIVEAAKKDVAKLEVTDIPFDVPNLDGDGESFYPNRCDTVEYVFNREKRTVVALIRYMRGERSVWARGKSRCAPDDCFNVHIGKAIALRRALGLTVPAEYYESPQPTDIKPGYVIRTLDGRRYTCKYPHRAGEFRETIIDDSREEVSA